MRWGQPEWLWGVWVPLLLWWLGRGGSTVRFSAVGPWRAVGMRFSPRELASLVGSVGLCLAFVALARPQTGVTLSRSEHSGVDIFLAIDTSGSMQAIDMEWKGEKTTRMEVVKGTAAEFVERRPSDRLGLVVFGESAFVQSPLTLDHLVVQEFLKEVRVGMAGEATAVGDALGVAARHMKDLPAKSRVVVLLTDGASNAGALTPDQAARAASAYGIKVYTLAVGKPGRAPYLVQTPLGQRVVYQESEIDEGTLQRVAATTGGKFFRAQSTEELEGVYTQIDALEKTDAVRPEWVRYEERYLPWLLAAMALLALEMLLSLFWVRGVA